MSPKILTKCQFEEILLPMRVRGVCGVGSGKSGCDEGRVLVQLPLLTLDVCKFLPGTQKSNMLHTTEPLKETHYVPEKHTEKI